MKKWVMMIIITHIPAMVYSQDWQAAFNLDSKVGYNTNTYLNPYFSEWNPQVNSVYGLLAPVGQLSYSKQKFSVSALAGGAFEPVFDSRETYHSRFGSLNFRYRLTSKLQAGIDTGGSYFSAANQQELYWLQPVFSYSSSLFTQIRAKAGSSFRTYSTDTEGDVSNRFDSYALEIETWPSFNWQLKAGVYGSLDDPTGQLNTFIAVDHLFSSSLRFSARLGLEQYQYQLAMEGGGGPPIGGPGQQTQISNESDRFVRSGVGASYQFNKSFAMTLQADYLNYFSTASNSASSDVHTSAGIRYTFSPGGRLKDNARAEWERKDDEIVGVEVNYSGNGRLYIIGDFNEWEKPGIPLVHQKRNRYVAQLPLDPGVYEYKVLEIENSEEKWIKLTDDTYTVPDGFGDENGLIFID